jgi:hypothetical protein
MVSNLVEIGCSFVNDVFKVDEWNLGTVECDQFVDRRYGAPPDRWRSDETPLEPSEDVLLPFGCRRVVAPR